MHIPNLHMLVGYIGKLHPKYEKGIDLDASRTRAKNARYLNDGRIFREDVYNLDVIIAVRYRVKSVKLVLFRKLVL